PPPAEGTGAVPFCDRVAERTAEQQWQPRDLDGRVNGLGQGAYGVEAVGLVELEAIELCDVRHRFAESGDVGRVAAEHRDVIAPGGADLGLQVGVDDGPGVGRNPARFQTGLEAGPVDGGGVADLVDQQFQLDLTVTEIPGRLHAAVVDGNPNPLAG